MVTNPYSSGHVFLRSPNRQMRLWSHKLRRRCPKGLGPLLNFVSGYDPHPGRHHRLLVYAQPRYSLVDDWQYWMSPDIDWLARCPVVEGFFLACSQQQLVVPQGRLLLKLSTPATLRPQTSRHPQACHIRPLGSRWCAKGHVDYLFIVPLLHPRAVCFPFRRSERSGANRR